MRPLAIWAIQWAHTMPQQPKREQEQLLRPQEQEETSIMFQQHAGFIKVADYLKNTNGNSHRNRIQATYETFLKLMRL